MSSRQKKKKTSRTSSGWASIFTIGILLPAILVLYSLNHLRNIGVSTQEEDLLLLPPVAKSNEAGRNNNQDVLVFSADSVLVPKITQEVKYYLREKTLIPAHTSTIEENPEKEEEEKPEEEIPKEIILSDHNIHALPSDTVEIDLSSLKHIASTIRPPKETSFMEDISLIPDYATVTSRPKFMDFIGSPPSTLLKLGKGCKCQLLSIDCLDAIRCLPEETDVASGIALRNSMKKHAAFWRIPISDIGGSPIGMTSQFNTIYVFREWHSRNQLPQGLENFHEAFLDESRYPYCREHDLKGRNCFLQNFTTLEEEEDFFVNDPDKDSNSDEITRIKAPVKKEKQKKKLREMEERFQQLQSDPSSASPLDYLLAYCHISRITFQIRSHVYELYKKRLKEIDHNHERKRVQRVSLHLRRGDACRHAKEGYEEKASPLDSPSQASRDRLCYDTGVYMAVLQRIQSLLPEKHLVVYAATDHSQSLMDDIRTEYPDIYKSVSWKYLEYSRQIFDYFAGQELELGLEAYFIESPENKNKPLLGESAIVDIWHLSHGQVFIGHLGSRFGKLGWYQAIARYNSFVPFYTVDGHSVCCDIDESCGKMSKFVLSMENCLAIFYPDVDQFRTTKTEEDYWTKGATFRKIAAKKEKKFREDRIIETSTIANIEFTNLNANPVTWNYYPTKPQSVREPDIELDNKKCPRIMNTIDTSPPREKNPSKGACTGFEGILHIQHGDLGGASGTVFFQFMVGMLRWAEHHNVKPWVHLNDVSKVIFDQAVHKKEGTSLTKLTMLDGIKIGWARDSQDPMGYIIPGLPQRQLGAELERKEFVFEGTGVWEHYFEPVSDFSPGDDPSCLDKPYLTMELNHILPGLHSHASWVPHPWRYWMPDHVQQPETPFRDWFVPQRLHAAEIVKRYIRFNPYMEQRAACALPNPENSLGMHIRHGDKYPSRGIIETKSFLPFCKAFVEQGGGSIYLATDSALVFEEIKREWPTHVSGHVVVQPAVKGLSHNDTAAFDLGVSAHRTNVEALTDLRALSKCTYLLHGWSAMTEAVFFLNPDLIDRSVDLDDYTQSDQLNHFVQSILTK